jgi:hypothetical protein
LRNRTAQTAVEERDRARAEQRRAQTAQYALQFSLVQPDAAAGNVGPAEKLLGKE